jgi:hypothetical protein
MYGFSLCMYEKNKRTITTIIIISTTQNTHDTQNAHDTKYTKLKKRRYK